MPTHSQPERIGKYEILSVLGRGGMGIVYKARDPVIDRIVAVKTISVASQGLGEDQVERLLMEARSAGRLHHPNIVTVFDFGQEGDLSYIVMEYAEGLDLGQVIAAKMPLALSTKIDLLLQICNGLGYAHDRGVTHRDIKPSNVRVCHDGTAKLLDFGLARFDNTQLTRTGYVSGTISYMSPERIQGHTGPGDDIFALGAVAYELLTYERAFAGTEPPQVIFKIMTQSPPPPSTVAEVPPELDAVIAKSIAREPADRFLSAHEFATAVEDAMASPQVQAFLSSDQRTPDFVEAMKAAPVLRRRSSGSHSGNFALSSRGNVAVGSTQTMTAIAAAPTKITMNTAHDEAPPGPPTVIQTVERPVERSRGMLWVAIVSVVVIAAGIGYSLLHKSSSDVIGTKTSSVATTTATNTVTTTAPSDAVMKARTDLDELVRTARSHLEGARAGGLLVSPSRVSELEKQFDELRPVAEQGNDDAVRERGSRIVAEFDQLIHDSGKAGVTTVPLAPEPKRRHEPLVAAAAPPPGETAHAAPVTDSPRVAAATPQPAVVAAAPPPPVVAAAPAPPPTQPAADPRAEVSAFVRRIAAAYSSKDAGFFRDNYLRYTDAMGNAVRNSPSERVSLDIESVEVSDPQHARVIAQRTDEFGKGFPPQKQRLAYSLEKQNGAWKIAKFERQ